MSIGAESSSNINYNLVTDFFFCHDVYVRFLRTDVRYLANLWHIISFLALEGKCTLEFALDVVGEIICLFLMEEFGARNRSGRLMGGKKARDFLFRLFWQV